MSTFDLSCLRESDYARLSAALLSVVCAGDVICLHGGLGAGKTAFSRVLIQTAVGEAVEVPSPTFTLVQVYDEAAPCSIWHFDLYRLKSAEEIVELGWDDARASALSLIEWPERLGSLLPRDRLDISFSSVGGDEYARHLTLLPHGSWMQRLPSFSSLTQGHAL